MRSISRCLNKQLSEICQKSIQLEELSHRVTQLLPAELAAHCQVGSFNKGSLVLITSSAVWATPLRYAIPELRDKLRKEFGMYQLSSIKINIVEPNRYEPVKKTKSLSLSERTKEHIIKESQSCAYEPLKKALIHLAQSTLNDES